MRHDGFDMVRTPQNTLELGGGADVLRISMFLLDLAKRSPSLVTLAIDASASTDHPQMTAALEALKDALSTAGCSCQVSVLFFDTSVFGAFTRNDPSEIEPIDVRGQGGTMFLPVLDAINGLGAIDLSFVRRTGAHSKTPVVILTDGFGGDVTMGHVQKALDDDLYWLKIGSDL